VGGPVLFPSFLGCVLLLFGSALSAYATAEALTSGTIPLTSIQIGSFLNGNVIAGQQNIGKAKTGDTGSTPQSMPYPAAGAGLATSAPPRLDTARPLRHA
jgi:hypothetical protein